MKKDYMPCTRFPARSSSIISQYGQTGYTCNTGQRYRAIERQHHRMAQGVEFLSTKWTGRVSWLSYEDGLPSNNVYRLRMDKRVICGSSSSGLCRFNPMNNHITPMAGKRHPRIWTNQRGRPGLQPTGSILAATMSCYLTPVSFQIPGHRRTSSITDFKIFNEFLPVDSLLAAGRCETQP